MSSVGVLILLAVVGAVICAKARVPAGAVVFSLLALVLFVATPAGREVPAGIASFLSTFDDAATPVLNGEGSDATE